MPAPLLPAALLMCTGIALHQAIPIVPVVWTVLTLLLAAAALAAGRIGTTFGTTLGAASATRAARLFGAACLALAIVSAGLALAQAERFAFPADHVGRLMGPDPAMATVDVVIVEPVRVTQREQFGRPSTRQSALARVTAVETAGGRRSCSGTVLLSVGSGLPPLSQGMTVRVTGRLTRFEPPDNPGGYDWAEHYARRRVAGRLTASHASAVEVVEIGRRSLLDGARRAFQAVLSAGQADPQRPASMLLGALLTGQRDITGAAFEEDFRTIGASHHLSISGMHIGVLAGVVYGLGRLLRLHPRVVTAGTLGFVVIYGLLVVPSAPVGRSVLLAAVIAAGVLMRREVGLVNLLSACLIAMLAVAPLALHSPGFQLTFLTVLGLVTLTPRVTAWWSRFDDVDLAVADHFKPFTRGAVARRWMRWIRVPIAGAAVAWAVSAPVVAAHFGQINPWAVWASVLLSPLVYLTLVAALAKVALTIVVWPLAGAWAWLANLPAEATITAARWLARLPASDVASGAIPAWLVVAYAALLLWPAYGRSIGAAIRPAAGRAASTVWARLPFRARPTIRSASALAAAPADDGRAAAGDQRSAGVALSLAARHIRHHHHAAVGRRGAVCGDRNTRWRDRHRRRVIDTGRRLSHHHRTVPAAPSHRPYRSADPDPWRF